MPGDHPRTVFPTSAQWRGPGRELQRLGCCMVRSLESWVFVFCAAALCCTKNKCPSWRGKATGRPRRKGAGLWRSSERSEDPLQKKRADQAQCLARKGGFSFMGRDGKEGARSAQEKFEQPILS